MNRKITFLPQKEKDAISEIVIAYVTGQSFDGELQDAIKEQLDDGMMEWRFNSQYKTLVKFSHFIDSRCAITNTLLIDFIFSDITHKFPSIDQSVVVRTLYKSGSLQFLQPTNMTDLPH